MSRIRGYNSVNLRLGHQTLEIRNPKRDLEMTKTTSIKKDFDAVAFMRQQRDRISKDIANMDFEQIKDYFAKKRTTKRPAANRVARPTSKR